VLPGGPLRSPSSQGTAFTPTLLRHAVPQAPGCGRAVPGTSRSGPRSLGWVPVVSSSPPQHWTVGSLSPSSWSKREHACPTSLHTIALVLSEWGLVAQRNGNAGAHRPCHLRRCLTTAPGTALESPRDGRHQGAGCACRQAMPVLPLMVSSILDLVQLLIGHLEGLAEAATTIRVPASPRVPSSMFSASLFPARTV